MEPVTPKMEDKLNTPSLVEEEEWGSGRGDTSSRLMFYSVCKNAAFITAHSPENEDNRD